MGNENEAPAEVPSGAGDRRRTERRESDRRSTDRRAAGTPWRTPAAYVGYGILGGFLIFVAARGIDLPGGQATTRVTGAPVTAGSESVYETPATTISAAARNAYSLVDFEVLLAEGESAVGQLVRTELYCEGIRPISVRVEPGEPSVLTDMADAEGRVGGAECRWSDEARSSDFLLVIPPELAARFAAMPEVEMNFVLRRRVPADVEWLGRSEPLALRTAGILRAVNE